MYIIRRSNKYFGFFSASRKNPTFPVNKLNPNMHTKSKPIENAKLGKALNPAFDNRVNKRPPSAIAKPAKRPNKNVLISFCMFLL